MVNGLGVVGWGVGGIEAEAAMLGQPSSMLIPPVLGYRLSGTAAGRRHRHRPRADDHRSAAQEGRGRQVRRVLRTGPRAPDHCRSRDARQHVSRVRRHRRDLPDRRHDARVPEAHRPRRAADRAGRSLCPRAGALPNRRCPGCGLQRDHGARSVDRGAEPGRTAPPAGSRAAVEGEDLICRRARRAEEGREGARPPVVAPRWPRRPISNTARS